MHHKLYICAGLISAVSIISCTHESTDIVLPEESSTPKEITLKASFTGAETKTAIDASDGSIWWQPHEQIFVYTDGGHHAIFEGTNDVPALSTEFKGHFDGYEPQSGEMFYAIACADVIWENGGPIINLPEYQVSKDGNYDNYAFPSVAQSNNHELYFRNVCGGIQFSVNDPDIAKVTIRGNGEEILSGTFTYSLNSEGVPTASVKDFGRKENTVLPGINPEGPPATFTPGQKYYLTAFPTAFNGGVMITIIKTNGDTAVKIYDKAVSIKRAIWAQLGDIDAGLTFQSGVPEYGTITYETTDNQPVSISGAENTWDAAKKIGTVRLDNNTLPAIFMNQKTLKRVNVSYSVEYLADKCFWGCENLVEVQLPESIRGIGDSAFFNCYALTSVGNIPHVRSYSRAAFWNASSLKEFKFAEGTTAIPESFFMGCESLESVYLPATITSIGESAFYGCLSLTGITLTDAMNYFGQNAFLGVPVELYNAHYYVHCPASAKSVSIPDSVEIICDEAFMNCTELVSCHLPGNLTSLGASSFFGCTSLSEIEIPAGVTIIPGHAFDRTGVKTVKLPGGITNIATYAFHECKQLTSIELPDNLSEIGSYAFAECSSLKDIVIPDSVTYVERNAFSHNPSLEKAKLPTNLAFIPVGMFSFDTALKVIDIPESVTSIAAAFWGCEGLETVVLHTAPPVTVGADASTCFSNTTCLFYVPDEQIDAYQADSSWSTVAERIRGISQLP